MEHCVNKNLVDYLKNLPREENTGYFVDFSIQIADVSCKPTSYDSLNSLNTIKPNLLSYLDSELICFKLLSLATLTCLINSDPFARVTW